MSAASTAEGRRLFRPEAQEAQRQALLGRILINTPLAYWWITCVDLRCCRSDGDASSSAGVRFVHVTLPCARRAGRIDTFGSGPRSKLGHSFQRAPSRQYPACRCRCTSGVSLHTEPVLRMASNFHG